jgi:predicted outer membrane repeat protein
MTSYAARLSPLLLTTAVAAAGLLLLFASLKPAAGSPAVPAATFIVSNLSDSGAGSLRQAILDANASPGADVIEVTVAGAVNLLSALPQITGSVTIQGPGAGQFVVDGGDAFRVLDIAGVDVTLTGLTIQRGHVSGASPHGAGIRSTGNLTLSHVELLSNTAQSQGGGVQVAGNLVITGSLFRSNHSTSGVGGALRSGSAAAIGDTFFLDNSSWGDGGAVYALGSLVINDGHFQENRCLAGSCDGGALFSFSQTTLNNTQFLSNTAQDQGGGAAAPGFLSVIGGQFAGNRATFGTGGALFAQNTAAVEGTMFTGNTARSSGGGIYALGALSVTGAAFYGNESTLAAGGGLSVSGPVAISNTRFLHNLATEGGAIYHANLGTGSIVNSLLAGNQSARATGAAMLLASPGSFDVVHVTIADQVGAAGSAIHIITGTARITNTIVTSHSIAISNSGGLVLQDYNLLFGNAVDTQGAVSGGAHNMSGAPDFIAPTLDDFHIGAGSAAIDAGADAGIVTDYDGETRPQDAGFDIGFDEVSYIAGLTFTSTPSPAIAGLPTTFAATVTRGTGVSYTWDFGDGTPTVTGNPAVHTFASAGQFPVTITGTSSTGTASATLTVTVLPPGTTGHKLYLPLLFQQP